MSSARDDKHIACASPEVLDRIAGMMTKARTDRCYELEARLGKVRDNKFVPGVSREHMDSIICSLDILYKDSPHSVAVVNESWAEEENYYFVYGDKKMRTRVTFADDKVTPTTIEKVLIDSVVLKTHCIDVRISLARECTVKPTPSIVSTTHMRIKQRRSFQLLESPFVIECAMVWAGVNKVETEARQSSIDPIFEIECELSHPLNASWVGRHRNNPRRMARSFLYKVSDVMLNTGITFMIT